MTTNPADDCGCPVPFAQTVLVEGTRLCPDCAASGADLAPWDAADLPLVLADGTVATPDDVAVLADAELLRRAAG
ncbi:hypothetical protein ACFV0O_41375 [Kitasatospora sp. NPDC059577]|uniref:TraR/DksA C4-type zinc finger protein n=1 Tax=Kitasatospora sp. NPDC059577 TaxID=3346873 RepID=UPI0036ADE8F3